MKKQRRFQVFIGVFLLLCLLPSAGMLLFGPSPLLANESAPRTPALTGRDGKFNKAVLEETADYIGSRFALRPALVTARSWLFETLLGSSAEEQVTLGRDGQLFYSSTLDDYCGQGLSDAELRAAAENLAAMQAAVESRGGTFLFTVAPNKNSVIPDAMPDRFPEDRGSSNYARLLPLLEEYGVHYADLLTPLSADPSLYYRTDSHWTAEGAALAADTLLGSLGRDSAFAAGPFAEDGRHAGDLYQMLYPLGKGREAELVYAPGFRHVTASDPRGGNAITIETSCEGGSGSLFCLRDSFGIALYPYLAEAFETAVFSRSADYTAEAFGETDADVVILEIVERNIASLLPGSEDPS